MSWIYTMTFQFFASLFGWNVNSLAIKNETNDNSVNISNRIENHQNNNYVQKLLLASPTAWPPRVVPNVAPCFLIAESEPAAHMRANVDVYLFFGRNTDAPLFGLTENIVNNTTHHTTNCSVETESNSLTLFRAVTALSSGRLPEVGGTQRVFSCFAAPHAKTTEEVVRAFRCLSARLRPDCLHVRYYVDALHAEEVENDQAKIMRQSQTQFMDQVFTLTSFLC